MVNMVNTDGINDEQSSLPFKTCIFPKGQQWVTPLVARKCPVSCKLMRKLPYFSLDLIHRETVSSRIMVSIASFMLSLIQNDVCVNYGPIYRKIDHKPGFDLGLVFLVIDKMLPWLVLKSSVTLLLAQKTTVAMIVMPTSRLHNCSPHTNSRGGGKHYTCLTLACEHCHSS